MVDDHADLHEVLSTVSIEVEIVAAVLVRRAWLPVWATPNPTGPE